jgi:hypothetical protein
MVQKDYLGRVFPRWNSESRSAPLRSAVAPAAAPVRAGRTRGLVVGDPGDPALLYCWQFDRQGLNLGVTI